MSLKDAIREAANARDQQSNIAEVANPTAPPQDDTINTASNKAAKQVNSKAVKQVSSNEQKKVAVTGDVPDEELAAMTVRVSRRHRIHWLISAKKQDTTLTAAITEALNARFGEPTD